MIDVLTISITLLGVGAMLSGFGVGMYFLIKNRFNQAANLIADTIGEVLGTAPVKRAMGILGKHGAESRAVDSVVEDAAEQFLSGPNLAGLKTMGKFVGLDLDAMVEEHGPSQTLVGLKQFADMLGIDILQIAREGIKGITPLLGGGTSSPQGGTSSEPNPYLGD